MRRVFRLQHSLPPLQAVLGRLGYNPSRTSAEEWRARIEEAIVECDPLLEAVGVLDTVRVLSVNSETISLEGDLVFSSRRLATVLARSEEVTVLAATVGVGIVHRIQEWLQAGEVTRAAIVDAVASESVEHFVDWMQAIVAREKLRFGYVPTMRFSPGYGDWKLDIQPHLLRFLGAEEIGITSHPQSHILQPEKSITAVIGWERRPGS